MASEPGWDSDALDWATDTRRSTAATPSDRPLSLFAKVTAALATVVGLNLAVQRQKALLVPDAPGDWIAVFRGPDDERKCQLCRELLGMKLLVDSPEYRMYSPPLHPRCRDWWEYLAPGERGYGVDIRAPSRELIAAYGPYVGITEAERRVLLPGDPKTSWFAWMTVRGRRQLVFAPDRGLSVAALAALGRIVARDRPMRFQPGAWTLAVGDRQRGLGELEAKGLIRTRREKDAKGHFWIIVMLTAAGYLEWQRLKQKDAVPVAPSESRDEDLTAEETPD